MRFGALAAHSLGLYGAFVGHAPMLGAGAARVGRAYA